MHFYYRNFHSFVGYERVDHKIEIERENDRIMKRERRREERGVE